MTALNVQNFGAVPGTDCTKQFESAMAEARSTGRSLEVPPSNLPYKVQHLVMPAIEMFGSLGTVIEHEAPDTNTDCIWMVGEYERPSILRDITVKGLPGIGRDLVSVRKGDHPLIQNVWMKDARRNGFKAIPHTSFYWIENMNLIGCKVINPGEDDYAFEILNGFDQDGLPHKQKFINCTQMIGCESRQAGRHAIRLTSQQSGDHNAKISSFSVIGGEYAVNYGVDPTQPAIKFESANGGFIENVTFLNTTIEYAGGLGLPPKRLGHLMEIDGLMKGYFDFKATGWHGTEYFIKGFRNFPDYDVYDMISRRTFRSQQGITDEFKSDVYVSPLNDEYTGVICQSGEIFKGYVLERYNNDFIYAEFTVINGKFLVCPDTAKHNMDVKLINGEIVLTNKYSNSVKFEMVFQRVAVASPY